MRAALRLQLSIRAKSYLVAAQEPADAETPAEVRELKESIARLEAMNDPDVEPVVEAKRRRLEGLLTGSMDAAGITKLFSTSTLAHWEKAEGDPELFRELLISLGVMVVMDNGLPAYFKSKIGSGEINATRKGQVVEIEGIPFLPDGTLASDISPDAIIYRTADGRTVADETLADAERFGFPQDAIDARKARIMQERGEA